MGYELAATARTGAPMDGTPARSARTVEHIAARHRAVHVAQNALRKRDDQLLSTFHERSHTSVSVSRCSRASICCSVQWPPRETQGAHNRWWSSLTAVARSTIVSTHVVESSKVAPSWRTPMRYGRPREPHQVATPSPFLWCSSQPSHDLSEIERTLGFPRLARGHQWLSKLLNQFLRSRP